jgi:hypothetical protein
MVKPVRGIPEYGFTKLSTVKVNVVPAGAVAEIG